MEFIEFVELMEFVELQGSRVTGLQGSIFWLGLENSRLKRPEPD